MGTDRLQFDNKNNFARTTQTAESLIQYPFRAPRARRFAFLFLLRSSVAATATSVQTINPYSTDCGRKSQVGSEKKPRG